MNTSSSLTRRTGFLINIKALLTFCQALCLHFVGKILQGKEAPFGSPYIMEILDTVVAGHEGFSEGSREYLVFEKVLLSVAKKYGLHPVSGRGTASTLQECAAASFAGNSTACC